MRSSLRGTTALALLAAVPMLASAGGNDVAMTQLARNAGRLTCHQIAAAGKGPEGLPSIGPAMPPNAVAIQQADAKKLVGWILALDVPNK